MTAKHLQFLLSYFEYSKMSNLMISKAPLNKKTDFRRETANLCVTFRCKGAFRVDQWTMSYSFASNCFNDF